MRPELKLAVVAPAFNEAESIETVARRWLEILEGFGCDFEIVVVDDGSADGTASILQGIGSPRLRVQRFEPNVGYGRALREAIRLSTGDVVVTIDSDGQFDLADAQALIEKLDGEGLDLVTGFRRKKNDTAFRVLADRGLNLMVRLLFPLPYRDTNCALKAIRAELARSLAIEAIGFPTPTEIMARAAAQGAKMAELPVSHLERAGGKTKLKALKSAVDFTLFLGYLRFQLWLRKRGTLQGRT